MISNPIFWITTWLVSFSALFFLVQGTAIPEEHVQMMNRRDWYEHHSNSIVDFHRNNLREYNKEIAEWKQSKKQKRTAWYPQRTFSSGSLGHQAMYAGTPCPVGNIPRKYWYGTLVRTITFPGQSGAQYMWWLNRTTYAQDLTVGQPKECYPYGLPTYKYHSADGVNKVCKDKIWDPTSATWCVRDSSNTNLGWTTNNATYGNQKVRTIFDCHLDRVAVEYANNHPALGYKPIRYSLHGQTWFRFYDGNNFAWFLSCPPEWALKKRGEEGPNLQKRLPSNPGNNPIWDFLGDKHHHYAADNTPLYNYMSGLNDFAAAEEDPGYQYSADKIYTIVYWPPSQHRNITIENKVCVQLAVSRPGLRHWTVKFFDQPSYGWPQKTQEWGYPQDWQNLYQESGSKSANAP